MKIKCVLISALACGFSLCLSGCFHAGFEGVNKKTPCGEVYNKGFYFEAFGRPSPHDVQCPTEQSRPTVQYQYVPVPQPVPAPSPAVPAPAPVPAQPPCSYLNEYGLPVWENPAQAYAVEVPCEYPQEVVRVPVYSYQVAWNGSCYVRQRYISRYVARPRAYAPSYHYSQRPRYVSPRPAYRVMPPSPTVTYVRPTHPQPPAYRRHP